jgi:hypothetical protein
MEPRSKVCSECGRTLSIDAFRFRKRGDPARQGCCRECYNGRMRVYRLARRLKIIRGFSSQVLRASGPGAVSRLCAGMSRRFGGVDRFCDAWKAHIDAAPMGSPAALRAISAILRMLIVADAERQTEDFSGLTDEKLDREIHRLLGDQKRIS